MDQLHRPQARLLDWQSRRSGSLRGYVRVRFPDGVEIANISIHVMGTRAWATPPTRPWHDEAGQLHYAKIFTFSDHGSRRRWSEQVLRALIEARPGALGEELDLVGGEAVDGEGGA